MRKPIFNSQFSVLNLIKSMRLRTLPLSLAGVVCGGILAYGHSDSSVLTLALLFLTTVSLQILSNLSNEMGDHLSGVDGDNREGPNYSMADGGLTEKQMWRAINGTVITCAVSGLLMLLFSFHFDILNYKFIILILLGAAAIWASTHYTLGKSPYGYKGLGDIFVFIFFGLVSVMGSYFVIAHTIDWIMIWPAVGIGFLSIGVLNVNNIRDMQSDKGLRQTIPLRIGEKPAKIYQTALIIGGYACMLFSCHTMWLLSVVPLYAIHLYLVWSRESKRLDPALPLLVLTTFATSIVFVICCYGI